MSAQLMKEMGKGVCLKFPLPFLENIDRGNCNEDSSISQPSPSAVAPTLEYLAGVPSKAASSGRENKQVRIYIQETREYPECGIQISPKSPPLQSLFVGKGMNASYQPCS